MSPLIASPAGGLSQGAMAASPRREQIHISRRDTRIPPHRTQRAHRADRVVRPYDGTSGRRPLRSMTTHAVGRGALTPPHRGTRIPTPVTRSLARNDRAWDVGTPSPTSTIHCQKNCPVTSIGGKDSVKGNRQGSLSRSITRRSDQNCKIKCCFLFCNFASACQKSPFGLF